MAQVNVAYEEALLARIDALAAVRGMTRPDLLRSVAEEAVRASEQGRAMFEPQEMPIAPDTAVLLATKVEQISIDLDRLLRAAERREVKLLERFNATEEANRSAYDRMSKRLAETFKNGTTPYSKMLASFRDDVAKLHDEVLTASRKPEGIFEIRKELAAIRSAQERARPVTHLHFFRDVHPNGWLWGIIVTFGLAILMFGQVLLANILPYDVFATPVALKLFGSADTGICELYKSSRRLGECPPLAPVGTGGSS